jgi:hypothetical protein
MFSFGDSTGHRDALEPQSLRELFIYLQDHLSFGLLKLPSHAKVLSTIRAADSWRCQASCPGGVPFLSTQGCKDRCLGARVGFERLHCHSSDLPPVP